MHQISMPEHIFFKFRKFPKKMLKKHIRFGPLVEEIQPQIEKVKAGNFQMKFCDLSDKNIINILQLIITFLMGQKCYIKLKTLNRSTISKNSIFFLTHF